MSKRYEIDEEILKKIKKRPLTPREKEVLKLVIQGYTNIEIGNELHISINTSKAHLTSIMFKLGVKERLHAAVKAVTEGLVDMEEDKKE